ncbi:MAG: transketolase [Chloroflexota bacterium]
MITESANMGFASMPIDAALEAKAVNTIRLLAADAVQAANSGHPGMPMGMAQVAFTLWSQFMNYNPQNPDWMDRDRFVLSAGHGSMLIYAMLHLTGYDVSLDDLRNFRQWGSKTAGHPEYGHVPGVETTTGPLGQGFANGIGMAIAERWLAERFNRPDYTIIDHHVYAIVSDGDLMEGVASEAASLAGHLKLGKVIYLYDDNNITIDGKAEVSYSEDWAKRFDGYGWHVQSIDGMDGAAVAEAVKAAQADPRPSIIGCKTIIGYGSPNMADTSDIHGKAMGDAEIALTKEAMGWPTDTTFHIPDEVAALYQEAVPRGAALEAAQQERLDAYAAAYPAEATELQQMLSGGLPEGWEETIPSYGPGKAATRNSGGEVINSIAGAVQNLVGGSADLAGSTKTTIKGVDFMSADSFGGQNMHFGVREHGMAGILNGMALHGGVIPMGGTFLVFSDYMRASMRLAALMEQRVIYVLTHDSIGLGEDGPTHQPIEHLAALRTIPNLNVMRPADANETAEAWRAALLNDSGPTVMALTRQDIMIFDRDAEGFGPASGVAKGGYVLYENAPNGVDVILIASGSEVEIIYEAAQTLSAEGHGVRVVSLVSWELFSQQDEAYRQEVLPAGVAKVAVEAASPFGWERWVGNDKSKGDIIGIDHFGASAPYQRLYQEYGLTAENVVARAKALL